MAKGRWPKGVSGNPSGRPKLSPEESLIKQLRKHLSEVDPKTGKSYARLCAEKLVYQGAVAGSIRALGEIFDRIEGKAIQQLNLDATLKAATREQNIISILETIGEPLGSADDASDQLIQ